MQSPSFPTLPTSYSPRCTCSKLPHDRECPVAPFFDESEKLTLDNQDEDGKPFWIICPRCQAEYPQSVHAAGYDYSPTEGQTDQGDLPLVCPECGHSDKQFLPAIVGFDPAEEEDDLPFIFVCPECGTHHDRTDGILDVWVERNVLMGVDTAEVRGFEFKRGQIVDEYTELSLSCNNCGHSHGEDPE